MNPLQLPFGKKPKKEPAKKVPNYLGVKNEAVRDDEDAEQHITIIVSGLKGVPSGEFRLKWEPGQQLGQYFSRIKLKQTAIYAAVRNPDDLAAGRLRMTYIPKPGMRITVGNARLSSAVHLQRSNHNAESVARRMGGGARVVEVPLRKR